MIGRVKSQVTEVNKFVVDWMEHRTGILTAAEHFLYEPVPKRGVWLYTLGSATLFLISLQFLTGILLLFYYVPTVDHAWNSVYYIMNEAYFGQLIRGIHYWSANFLLAVIGLHMAQVFFSGGYKAPRELNWVVGVVLLLLVIGLAFTGYLLRWDQDGFWASVVGMKIGSYSPFIGSYVINFLLGGDVAGPATLSRFFAIHVWLLPAMIAPFIGIHLYLLRRHGVFGSEFEYTERLAKLHEQQRLEEYARYELGEDDEDGYDDGYNGSENGSGGNGYRE
ncbi:MAG: cytochrome b N-terminal domain-containing protein [Rubrobacteraceae bacterium]